MQKEQNRLQIDLKSAKTQINILFSQNFAKNSELQRAKAKLEMYNLEYKRDFEVKQQCKKHKRVQEDC